MQIGVGAGRLTIGTSLTFIVTVEVWEAQLDPESVGVSSFANCN